MQELAKTKVCSIFEPTYRSIMTLPSEEMRLRMFIALCNYAFERTEPKFGIETEERILAALWEQFRVVFVQSEKRTLINTINGAKGGRPKKSKENHGFSFDNLNNPTNTFTNTYTRMETTADFDLIKTSITNALNIEDCDIFSEDLVPSLVEFFESKTMNSEEIESYLKFVGEYSTKQCPNNRINYFYSVVTKDDMYLTYLSSQN